MTLLEEDSDGTPSKSEAESLLCDTEDTESDDLPEEDAMVEPPPMLLVIGCCIEALGESVPCQTATFVIMRSVGSVAKKETYLLDQST